MANRVPPVSAFVLVAALAATLTGCRREPETAQVVRRDVIAYESLEGQLVTPPSAQADVHAHFAAPVDQVMVTVGQTVNRGEVLVQLSYPSAEAALEQARRNVQTLEATLNSARQQYDASVREAEQRFQQARERERQARIGVDPEMPSPDLAAATQERQMAEQQLQQVRADRKLALTPYEQQLEQARSDLRSAQQGVRTASVRAPINGQVLELNARPGLEVGTDPQTPVARIVNLNEIQAHAPVTPEQSTRIEPRTPALLTFEDLQNEQFEGQVARITTDPEARRGGAQPREVAIVTFQNRQGMVKPGSRLSALLVEIDRVENVLAVPARAVQQDDQRRPVVQVMRNGQWQPVPVEVGLSDGNFTEIRNGIEEGETVQVPARGLGR
jgi:RND family efflux transporter MFP subunit